MVGYCRQSHRSRRRAHHRLYIHARFYKKTRPQLAVSDTIISRLYNDIVIDMKIFGIDLCQYKDIFGSPREGAHAYRVFDIAVVDVAATIIVAFIIYRAFNLSFWKSLVTLFIIGIISHRAFCVRTTVDKWVFPNI